MVYFAEIPLSHSHYIHHPKYINKPMIYLLIAIKADLQEHKRDIAKRAQPSVLCIVLVFYIFSLQKIS